MIIRIVKMSFNEADVPQFLTLFEEIKHNIRGFNGCNFLELYRDLHNTNVFFTYSYWDTEDDLNTYRHSDLFKGIWSQTKPLFNAKTEAWSVNRESVTE
jgi:heme-degrading monooxygenase HmoA